MKCTSYGLSLSKGMHDYCQVNLFLRLSQKMPTYFATTTIAEDRNGMLKIGSRSYSLKLGYFTAIIENEKCIGFDVDRTVMKIVIA